MKHTLLSASLAFVLAGCGYRPYLSTKVDPFTGISTKSMYVDKKLSEMITQEWAYSGTGVDVKKLNQNGRSFFDVILSSSEGDTMLTVIRWQPQIKYDVPQNANLLLLSKDSRADVIALPILRKYHTIGGPLIVKSRVDRPTLKLLSESEVLAFRIDAVRPNESDLEPATFTCPLEYPKAFRKGVQQFLAQAKRSKQQPAKAAKPPKYF